MLEDASTKFDEHVTYIMVGFQYNTLNTGVYDMHYAFSCRVATLIAASVILCNAAAAQISSAKVVIVNNTNYDLTNVGVVHKPSRSIKFQWVDPKPINKDDDGLWKNVLKRTSSTQSRTIRFATGSRIKERNWWFVVFSYRGKDGQDKILALDPKNGQAILDTVARVTGIATQTVGSNELTKMLQAAIGGTPPAALATLVVSGIFKAVIDPAQLKSRAGFKEKSIHPQDANKTIQLIISGEEGDMRLRIAMPSGSTEGFTEFNEQGAELVDIYKHMFDQVKSKTADKS